MTWGVPLSVSYHFAFSYCSWGSQGKNTEVVCHSLLQGTIFCQTSPPWPAHSWVAPQAWLTFIELDKAVVLVWLDWLVFCEYDFSVSALWCPLATPTILFGFLLWMPCLILYFKAKIACYSRCFLTSYFSIPHWRSGSVAVRKYPSSKVRSSGCALLEQPWRDTPRPR